MFSRHKKGHGIHSPFVYDLIKNVFNDKTDYSVYDKIENSRKKILSDERTIEVNDLGAGSRIFKTSFRKIKDIAKTSVLEKKYGQLLFRIVNYFKPENIIEMGTSLGISTLYLASGNPDAKIYTIEGCKNIHDFSRSLFDDYKDLNIKTICGSFDQELPRLLMDIEKPDFIFFDGNHKKEATLYYFNTCLEKAHSKTIFFFDDINWSKEMQEAWQKIIIHNKVSVSIDLY
ncbi:MAG: class I SAM-dependent methyltransferase, partial [Bacteroidota bacterium]